MGVKGMIKKVGEIPTVIAYEAELQTKRGQYEEWLFWQEHDRKMTEGFEEGEGEVKAPESYFGNHPYRAIQVCFAHHPMTMLLYGDEDVKGKNGGKEMPWFRPKWSPELLESCFYLGSLIAVRRTFLEKNLPDWKDVLGPFEVHGEEDHKTEGASLAEAAVFVNETPSEEYRKAIHQLCEKAGGWERGCGAIEHLPGILWHCSEAERLLGFAAPQTGLQHTQISPEGQQLPQNPPEGLLSTIILTKDHPELLQQCVSALRRAAEGKGFSLEIIVVDNGSSEENRRKLESLPGILYSYKPMDFNFSKLCNIGAGMAKGRWLLFLNDDVELLPESHLERMVALADRPGVGSVGLKLYYPNSRMIQHAGITNLPTGPVHKLLFLDDEKEYYFGRNRGLHDLLAVSAACVMLRAEVFEEAGRFDESLPVAYNDVALGFRLYEMGYRNVCACDAHAFHHESLTRGSDADERKRERLLEEHKRLCAMFPELEGKDPYFSEYLSRQASDTMIRPAYETAKNACQIIVPKAATKLEGIRMDECLRVQIEEDRNGEMLGYALVLGDDNACYDRWIVFEKESGERYKASLHCQYRPDLPEKFADQTRVELIGFWIYLERGTLPPGRYRVGCLAKRKVGNLKLFCWSAHVMKIVEE